jgi:hypothetical protein
MSNVQYLSCAQTAKLVRAALKEAFPGVKFSVKSSTYAGGASINVSYTDGPSASQVEGIAKAFQGSYFDGMTDYKGSNYNSIDGQQVSFGADFVFVNRKFTAPTLTGIVVDVCNKYGFDNEILIDGGGEYFGAYIKAVGPNADSEARGFTTYDIDLIIREAASKFSMDDAAESATLARVAFLGDDGYGWNSVGRMAA